MANLEWGGLNIPRDGAVPPECSKMQGVLAVGPAKWQAVLDYCAEPTTGWAERMIVESAATWHRDSQSIQFFAWLMNLSPDEVDDLFRIAVRIEM